MIRTGRAVDEMMRQQRIALTVLFADAIDAMFTEDCRCPHNRPSCPVCAEKRTIQAASAVVRETGGTP